MNDSDRKNVVIIGGGPTGLGTALMLATRGWKDIIVIEKRPSADYYEPDKSFNYQIDGRGQKLTDFLNLTDQLADLSVPNTDFYLTLIKPDGTRKVTKLPIVDPERKTAYWLPRASFVQLFYQEIETYWQDSIQVLFNTNCLEIKVIEDQLTVIAQSPDNEKLTFIPTLLVGGDGLKSIVRKTVQKTEDNSNSFAMQMFPSPSSGLRYKVLTLPPQFPLSEEEKDTTNSTMAYAIRSVFKEKNKAISLGLLPFKNPKQPRTANIITYPDHQIWQLKRSEEVKQFLISAFPQIPLEKIVSDEEIARFTCSEGGQFPMPQFSSGVYKIWGEPDKHKGTAVILLGDAVHCFPPDIGQGVNSALEDVYIFQEILEETEDNLSQALPIYQKRRQDDIKALIRLVQISYPWQYNQDPLQKKLWSINFFIRLILSRFLPFIFNPHSFVLIQNHELSYSEILAKSNRTTFILLSLGVVGIILISLSIFLNSNLV
ncbi:unknown [Crocosphaera subtropica ATCC 51142]|uniref:FAD-binding domain-containing protein n=1 Tax=Crocosphaera subtropica (strain ATCC 51142 / BH68) TaxID=43989 RepID=B1WR65_CROS5|nr:NAD(P)/FAD-dependent oxidoreductase [Crocosphaera subtropica]ACB50123.1 unknown [Crocosphaera subtropica ATCC 51142]